MPPEDTGTPGCPGGSVNASHHCPDPQCACTTPAEDAATRLLMPRTPDSLALDSQQKPSAKRWKCGAAELTRQVDNI